MPETPATFALKGKVAVQEAGENFTANLLWHQDGDGFRIDLWGPLGQGRMQLVKQDGDLEIRDGSGDVVDRGEPEAVMRRALGWSMPMNVIPQWVVGQPSEELGIRNVSRDDADRITAFGQLDWQVSLERYRSWGSGEEVRDLPGRITAENARTRLRLVISEWEI
jgi:outer membrane lipoprotein LolB